MPVGEADKGIGAVKGKAYYGVQVQTSIIDWWHDPIESNEPYKHSGKLNTVLVRPSLIYGVSNKINLALSTQIGVRSMVWDQNSSSIHHRTETTLDGFNMLILAGLVTVKLFYAIWLKMTAWGRVYGLF